MLFSELVCLVSQSCLILCSPMDCSPPGFSVHGDSPGKNTGVGFHFLLQCMKVKSESEVAQSCPTLCDPMDFSPRNFPDKSTGVGCHFLLQGIFLTQGSKLSLPQCRQRLYL